jgi:hypothetical protein
MLYFPEIIHFLVDWINIFYHQYAGTLDDTNSEMFLFLGIIVQIGHDIRVRLSYR